ncbi:hypothetical protein F3K53_14990 [Pseudomonas veronii]|uniref:Uncharacterized protein n=1 Tax=Pseudomonas veronii TaxID=76761 RepID=A0A5M8F4M7_PSEVE|nr:hypothetical protein F3K54_16325 [Pseudomonas veronii]KAA6178630.1 hypothetical protein F3K53_14990 [Pseudomonas veronii]
MIKYQHRRHSGLGTEWRVENKYHVMLEVGRLKDYRHPAEERSLITLELARPGGLPLPRL